MGVDTTLAVISVVAAGMSTASAVARAIGAKMAQRRKLKQATEARFQSLLSSYDLTEIGSYLDDVIGEFEVGEYVGNPEVSRIVDAYLEKLNEFLQTDAEVEAEGKVPEEAPPREGLPPLGDELRRILQELQHGEPWNSLARLRRHIEITLRNVAGRRGIRAGQEKSAFRLLEVLHRKEVIDGMTFHRLRYAISVCNRVIHGDEVPRDAAEAAIRESAIALAALDATTDLSVSADAEGWETAAHRDQARVDAEEIASLRKRAKVAGEISLTEDVSAAQRQTLEDAGRAVDRLEEIGAELTAQAYVARGIRYGVRGDLASALAEFDRAVGLDPDCANAHVNRATALLHIERYEDALTAAERAVGLAPDNALTHHNRGAALARLGRSEEALAAYDRAIELAPNDARVHANRGAALARLGRREEALAADDRAIELAPNDAQAHANRGAVLGALGRHEEGLAAADRAIDLDPHYGPAYYSRACLHARLNNRDKALRDLAKAFELDAKLRAVARQNRDADFATLRDDPDFKKLVGLDEEGGEGE